MISLEQAVVDVLGVQALLSKPLAVIVAGHNGSGKSTMWRDKLADRLQIPLINADRMILSVLPEAGGDGQLPDWARELRDENLTWMKVAQQGVSAFVGQAIGAKAAFAMETVFSYWDPQPDGTVRSKLDILREMQAAGYFVVLVFVGLENADLSIARVQTRVARGGHAVDPDTLLKRFPRTQKAISAAAPLADACILVDNSRGAREAFSVCQVRMGESIWYDIRSDGGAPSGIRRWLDIVAPPAP